jgi:hypothetical protein
VVVTNNLESYNLHKIMNVLRVIRQISESVGKEEVFVTDWHPVGQANKANGCL